MSYFQCKIYVKYPPPILKKFIFLSGGSTTICGQFLFENISFQLIKDIKHPVVLRTNSLMVLSSESVLVGLSVSCRVLGVEPQLAVYKANALLLYYFSSPQMYEYLSGQLSLLFLIIHFRKLSHFKSLYVILNYSYGHFFC